MTDIKKLQNSGVNPVAVGVAGAIVGAGVAMIATKAMQNEKTREQVKKVLNRVRDHATGYLDNAQAEVDQKTEEIKDKLAE